MRLDDADPKGLIRESYRMDGLSRGECRSIFLDWALSIAPGTDPRAALHALLAEHGSDVRHPMTQVMIEGLAAGPEPRRRGGRAGRASRVEGPD